MSSKKVHEDLKALANGINHVLTSRFGDLTPEFVLIIVQYQEGEQGDQVTLNTITGIQDPNKIATIGQHLIDMAKAQTEPSLDPNNDSDVRGHA